MKIKLHKITVEKLIEGYNAESPDNDDVMGFGGRLTIRPAYQRNFVYDLTKQQAVIHSILNGYPLNVMYWVKIGDNKYEMLDGQQRTLSICSYRNGGFSYEDRLFSSLPNDIQKRLLDYKLNIYICEGEESEVLKWFEVINFAGEALKPQELRNAIYTCEWLSDAKRYFSKKRCPAYRIGYNYLNGSPIDQTYLETAIKWHAEAKNASDINQYMADKKHQGLSEATELWEYYNNVINWVRDTFPHTKDGTPLYKKQMKGVAWGVLYNVHKDDYKDDADGIKILATEIKTLMGDRDVTNKGGIFFYVLNGIEKHLSIRAFEEEDRLEIYDKQDGKCNICKEEFGIEDMEADHIIPWSKGGKTIIENCQMLCANCNREKTNK